MGIWSWRTGRRNGPAAKPLTLPAAVADIAGEGILYFGSHGSLQYANPAARVLLEGVPSGDFKSFRMFLDDRGKNCSSTKDSEGTITNMSCLLELRERWIRMRAARMDDGGMSVILSDVTEAISKKPESSGLQKENREMEQALEAMAGGVALLCLRNGTTDVRFANSLFRQMTGMNENGADGDFARALHESTGADSLLFTKALRAGTKTTLQWRRDRRDMPPQWFEAVLTPLAPTGMTADFYVFFLNDVTEAHVQKAQLFQSQKLEALGQLAGGVAHDFNNLLSIVDGYTRMALKHVPPDNPAANYLERIKQANRRGAALTKQLLTFGRHKIVSESVTDIGQLLTEQEPLLRPLLNASIGLTIQADDGMFIESAPDGIAQILMNLVINARDAMPDGGTIGISAAGVDRDDLPPGLRIDRGKCEQFVRLSVEDTGTGMDIETQARIFDPFFTTKDQGKGSGLGLSMVYGIVRQSGGAIDVLSAPGAGTAMSIYFPLSKKRPEKKSIVRTADGSGMKFEGYTALLAEDEPDLLFVVGNMLEDMGIKVIKAADGNDALLKQDDYEGKIDFVLTDVVMPELDGVRLAEMMAEVRPESKILFMSGYPANGAMARVQLPDNAWLLAKPVEFDRLAGILAARLQDNADAKDKSTHGLYRWQSASGGAA